MVVVSHRSVVEHGRHFRTTGVLDQQFSGFRIGIDGVYSKNISSLLRAIPDGIPFQITAIRGQPYPVSTSSVY